MRVRWALEEVGQACDVHLVSSAYLARAEARPAYRRAFAAQLAMFERRWQD